MPDYKFVNVAASAGDAFKAAMAEREEAKRREMLDRFTLDAQRADLRLRQDQEARIAAAQQAATQRQQRVDTEADADRLAGILGPDADLSDEAAQTLERGGFQVNARKTLHARSLDMPTATPGFTGDRAPVVPGIVMRQDDYKRRNPTYLEQQAASQRDVAAAERELDRSFRRDTAQENRDAVKERADSDRNTRELIARLSASGSSESRALGDQLKQLQIDAAREKRDTPRPSIGGEKAALGFFNRARQADGEATAPGAEDRSIKGLDDPSRIAARTASDPR